MEGPDWITDSSKWPQWTMDNQQIPSTLTPEDKQVSSELIETSGPSSKVRLHCIDIHTLVCTELWNRNTTKWSLSCIGNSESFELIDL